MRICSSKNNITSNTSRHYLCHYVLVGKSDNKSVLGGVVLVLILVNQANTSTIISLPLSSSLELDLVTLEVSLGFLSLNINHCCRRSWIRKS
uniref:Uncharacterized protein n=1 Tax=Medicago truncatula TaxID=3880 RepID=I3SJF8_MEDTR|nr:unknown [Medicago truncatula]